MTFQAPAWKQGGLYVLILSAALLLLLPTVHAMSFVYRSGNQLAADGGPFYHMGCNAYWMPSCAGYGDTGSVDSVLDASQRLGLTVVRTWAFTEGFPSSPGVYGEVQGKGLDYVVAGAGKRGLRLVLALGNLWPAYVGPEHWLAWAEGSAAGKTVADFYKSSAAMALYRAHIVNVTSRVNTITGVAYKDDPAIMGYDLLNEPRCPGCDSADIAARDSWLSSLASAVKSAAPNQLVFSGTEGYFAAGDPNVAYNPGAGAQCDGEHWTQEISYFDVATTHMYYRQMEHQVQLGWQKPDFNFYVQYLHHKLQLYTDLAAGAGRPLVVEEFGLTYRFFGEEERKVVFAVVADAIIAAKRAGKPLMGALFWNAAPPGGQMCADGQPNVGGYDVHVTRQPSGAAVGLGTGAAAASGTASSPGPDRVVLQDGEQDKKGDAGQGQGTSSSEAPKSGHRKLLLDQAELPLKTSLSSPLPAVAAGAAGQPAVAASPFLSNTQTPGLAVPVAQHSNAHALAGSHQQRQSQQQRKLQLTVDHLDGFRRGSQREACAVAASYNWRMADVATAVNVEAYRAMVAGHDIVDVIAEATRLLKS